MKAVLQKISANKDKKDSVQFQLREMETEDCADEIMSLRRYDKVTVKFESRQSQIDENGVIHNPEFSFDSIATSISLCVTQEGIITTITFSFEDPKVFDEVVKNSLRNQYVNLTFRRSE